MGPRSGWKRGNKMNREECEAPQQIMVARHRKFERGEAALRSNLHDPSFEGIERRGEAPKAG